MKNICSLMLILNAKGAKDTQRAQFDACPLRSLRKNFAFLAVKNLHNRFKKRIFAQ